jgi:hypothetical protein
MSEPYDESCADLAEAFLLDSSCPDRDLGAAIDDLALLIQHTIEGYMASMNYD